MPPTRTIAPLPWMTAPETLTVMAALQGDAPEPMALFVGGCVRNAVLGNTQGDIDIATRWLPHETTQRLQAASIKVVPTGIDHGTVTAVCHGKPFEITSLRKDVATDGRRATVAFTQDWTEDAQRRDFTMNTLLCDADGHIFDPTGEGLTDLEAGRVRFVGDADQRIVEDYLRILRFFRFHAIYGRGEPDATALAACRDGSNGIASLSRERITQEMSRIVMIDNPVPILKLMHDNFVLRDLFHAAYDPHKMEALSRFQTQHCWYSFAARLIVMADYDAAFVADMKGTLIFSRALKKECEILLACTSTDFTPNEASIKHLIYTHGADIARQIVMLYIARRASQRLPDFAVDLLQNWIAPRFPLNGTDLINAGIPSGAAIGRDLTTIESWWIERGFVPDRNACLAEIQRKKEKF